MPPVILFPPVQAPSPQPSGLPLPLLQQLPSPWETQPVQPCGSPVSSAEGLARLVTCSGGGKEAVTTDSGSLRPPDARVSCAEGRTTEERDRGPCSFLFVPRHLRCGKLSTGLIGAGDPLTTGYVGGRSSHQASQWPGCGPHTGFWIGMKKLRLHLSLRIHCLWHR